MSLKKSSSVNHIGQEADNISTHCDVEGSDTPSNFRFSCVLSSLVELALTLGDRREPAIGAGLIFVIPSGLGGFRHWVGSSLSVTGVFQIYCDSSAKVFLHVV
jgi:hypothetical protein